MISAIHPRDVTIDAGTTSGCLRAAYPAGVHPAATTFPEALPTRTR
ncbi:hypothetical protein [Nocardia amamiensis]|nr:hypothetical protein [Nocardia amamiensis]